MSLSLKKNNIPLEEINNLIEEQVKETNKLIKLLSNNLYVDSLDLKVYSTLLIGQQTILEILLKIIN